MGHRPRVRHDRRPQVAGEQVEVTTYRADSYDGVTRKPTVEFGDTLEGDLVRRDFTVNAMALRVPGRTLVDPTGGVEDLARAAPAHARRPRASASATTRCGCCAPHASRRSSASTSTPRRSRRWPQLRETLSIVSPERIQGELVRLLQTDDPVRGIRLLVETGLMAQFLPEVPALRLEVDEHHHHKDVYEHSLTVLRQAIELEQAAASGCRARRAAAPGRAAARHRQAGDPQARARRRR